MKQRENEQREQFIRRCMESNEMRTKYPDRAQRVIECACRQTKV